MLKIISIQRVLACLMLICSPLLSAAPMFAQVEQKPAALTIQKTDDLSIQEPEDLTIQVIIDRSPKLAANWLSTKPGQELESKDYHRISRNNTIYAAFIVEGYKIDKDNMTNFVIDVNVINPSGSTLLKKTNWSAHAAKMPIKQSVILAGPLLNITFDDNDPGGVYRLQATVIDKISLEKSTYYCYLKLV